MEPQFISEDGVPIPVVRISQASIDATARAAADEPQFICRDCGGSGLVLDGGGRPVPCPTCQAIDPPSDRGTTSLPYSNAGDEPYPVHHVHQFTAWDATAAAEGRAGWHAHLIEDRASRWTAMTDGHRHRLP